MSEERMVKKVYKWKPMLTRPLGRPKNRREDDIRNDMKKMEIKNWTSSIQDRNNWKLYILRRAKLSTVEVVAPEEEESGAALRCSYQIVTCCSLRNCLLAPRQLTDRSGLVSAS
jgi:hypothetical protein